MSERFTPYNHLSSSDQKIFNEVKGIIEWAEDVNVLEHCERILDILLKRSIENSKH